MWINEKERAQPGGALKVVREPEVTFLAGTCLSWSSYCAMMEHKFSFTDMPPGPGYDDYLTRDGAWLIEFAGRECYQSWHNPAERDSDNYVRNIIRQCHYSVLEHVNVTFRFEGISRSLTHELIRHRHLSFSQLSQRYVDSGDSWYVCPPFFLTDYELYLEWRRITERQSRDVADLETLVRARHPELPNKQVREAVRSVAPNSIETKIVVTGNLRTWMELLPKRLSNGAEAEIRRLSEQVHEQLNEMYPFVFENVRGN